MKKLIFQVSVGKPSKLYTTCIDSVAEYCKKYSIDHIVLTEPKLKIRPDMERTGRSKEAVERLGYMPIYEKENAFEYFDRYDQIAIVDSDIYSVVQPQENPATVEKPKKSVISFGFMLSCSFTDAAKKRQHWQETCSGKSHNIVNFLEQLFLSIFLL